MPRCSAQGKNRHSFIILALPDAQATIAALTGDPYAVPTADGERFPLNPMTI
jgi:hypothetical protein